jgi:hypothetical protein
MSDYSACSQWHLKLSFIMILYCPVLLGPPVHHTFADLISSDLASCSERWRERKYIVPDADQVFLSLINPGYPLFNFTRKMVQLIVHVHLFRVLCIAHRFELSAVISFEINYFRFVLSLCTIIILEMYIDPVNNIIIPSQFTSYITRFVPDSNLALDFWRAYCHYIHDPG